MRSSDSAHIWTHPRCTLHRALSWPNLASLTAIVLDMEQQADSGQTWAHVGLSPHYGNGEPFESQEFDISNPPDLGNFLDTSSSDLQSSIGKSTNLTRMSDVTFGSDKIDPTSGHSRFETGDGTPSESLHAGKLYTGVSGYEVQSINPQVLLCDRGLADTRLLPQYQQVSRFTPMNASSDTITGQPSQMLYPNDFDFAFEETDMAPGVQKMDLGPLSYLGLWGLLNPSRLPSGKELKCLEGLAHIPAREIMTWLKTHMRVTSEQHANALQGVDIRKYRPKCLKSRRRKIQSGEPRLFECTNRCGQTFSKHRKGDWDRHERINFEEWVCYVCSDVLSRKEHLQKHLKASHDKQGINLESQKRQLLNSTDRPCGFCHKVFPTWSAWLAHVAAHFEGSIGGRTWKMSEWKERKITAIGPKKRPKPSSHHDTGSDDSNGDDDDDDDDDEDGGGGKNSGGSALNSNYHLSHNASGVGQGHTADDNFRPLHANFNGYLGGTTSQTLANIQRVPSLSSTGKTKTPIDHTQEIAHRMAGLDVSAAKFEDASNTNAQTTSYAHSPTHGKEQPRIKSLASNFSKSAVTVTSHQVKRSIDRSQTKIWNGDKNFAMSRWLDEKPNQAPWNPLSVGSDLNRRGRSGRSSDVGSSDVGGSDVGGSLEKRNLDDSGYVSG